MGSQINRRPVRVASASGAITDMVENLAELAKNADVDFIVGDWLSEYNMAARGMLKAQRSESPGFDSAPAFEQQFVDSFQSALPDLAARKIKMAVNAGACDTELLYQRIQKIAEDSGTDLRVAWIEGDEVLDVVQEYVSEGAKLRNITTGQSFLEWGHSPVYAQCYLGSRGISQAFMNGADIVLCGRVADAAPTMGAAAYWHGWSSTEYQELAHTLIAGHLIECSYYVTGGNYTGFKTLPQGKSPLLNLPIARIQSDGTFFIECHHSKDRGGVVSVNTCRSQLLYELQGKRYYNSDVVAIVDQVKMEQAGPDSVFVHNIGFEKPPPTTKVGLTAPGGYQAEVHYFIVGLDAEEKAALLDKQLRFYLDVESMSKLTFTVSGTCPPNPASQDAATVDVRVFAQSPHADALSPSNFRNKCWNIVMSTYPGATFAVDDRQAFPKPYNEYFVTIMPQALVKHRAHLPWRERVIDIEPPGDTVPYVHQQEVQPVSEPQPLLSFGPSIMAPLGYIVHARSGDKGSDCNIGFFVRHEDEYTWLKSLLTVDRIIDILQNDYNGGRVERFELPNIQGKLILFTPRWFYLTSKS
ncbi:DUF1446 domain-containing protein [Fusarium pseudocircinatum]|uniref:DUF1446 domain-containing protein n=1 Tax=Fusarium pseudocircinatum TaxID=56676 RepID=A0A8H5PAE3_9HYPO|nr:DUF1446 domain-containing protein [Fusarium pseudocircinatum]